MSEIPFPRTSVVLIFYSGGSPIGGLPSAVRISNPLHLNPASAPAMRHNASFTHFQRSHMCLDVLWPCGIFNNLVPRARALSFNRDRATKRIAAPRNQTAIYVAFLNRAHRYAFSTNPRVGSFILFFWKTLTNAKRELMSATRTPIALTQKAATLVDVRLGLKEAAIYVKVQLNRTLYTFVLLLLLFVCLFLAEQRKSGLIIAGSFVCRKQ